MDRLTPHLLCCVLDLVPKSDLNSQVPAWLHASAHTFLACTTSLQPSRYFLGHDTFLGAAAHGRLAVCRLYKEWGAPIALVCRRRNIWICETALWFAAKNGHLKLCHFFWAWTDHSGTAIKCLTVEDLRGVCLANSAFVWAAIEGHLDVCQFFKSWKIIHPDGTVDNLTLKDVRAGNCAVLRWSILHARVTLCQFFKDWVEHRTDDTQDRLTLEEVTKMSNYGDIMTWTMNSDSVDVCTFVRRWFQEEGLESQGNTRARMRSGLDEAISYPRGASFVWNEKWLINPVNLYMRHWLAELSQPSMAPSLTHLSVSFPSGSNAPGFSGNTKIEATRK